MNPRGAFIVALVVGFTTLGLSPPNVDPFPE